ncbi:MAG: hypothetical protein A2Y60_04950 [Chloroflexi bacterium RBG_13_54_9]|nr:MAG: hypothetical protein A2Y60_04950 [Chloroflexi bacterium RBG_13_54_9]
MERLLSFLKGFGTMLGTFSIVTALLAVLAFLAAAFIYVLLPELRSSVWTLLALGGLFLLLFLIGAFNQIKVALLGRRGRYSTNTTVMIVAFALIAVLVNFVGYRNHKRFDVTAAGQFTLSRQTLKILEDLKQPVNATGFFALGDVVQDVADDLLGEYAFHSNKFTYDFIDPDAQPAIARQYEIKEYETIIFESGERRQQVTVDGITEQGFTAAILKVTGTVQQKVYFLSGHGERDIANFAGDGYSYVKAGLEGDNYQVEVLNLAVTPEVPSDCTVLVIAGPQKPLLEQEMAPIAQYLERGGTAIILVDTTQALGLDGILAKWGVALGKGSIVDESSFVNPDIGTPLVPRTQYYYTTITQYLDATFFPEATSVSSILTEKQEEAGTITIFPLAETSQNSWLETELTPGQTPQFDDGKDVKGPLYLAVMAEASAPLGGTPVEGGKSTRLVVFGDSDFASDRYFYSLGNSDMFLNSVNWLAETEELISIRPKPSQYRMLVVSQRVWRWIYLSSIGLLPLAVAVLGGISWWRRR